MTDFITISTGIRTKQVEEAGTVDLISQGGFILTDLIVSSTSTGQVTLLVRDEDNTHIIASVGGKTTFSHAFPNGWTFWKNAKLQIVKELDDGIVNVAVGVVNSPNELTYDQWTRRANG